ETLDRVYELVKTNKDENRKMYLEHVTYYIYTHPEAFKVGYVKGDRPINLNLSVDTQEDFERARSLIECKGYKQVLEKLNSQQ
ncbi:MAG: hypothetical protein Q4F66_10035, partial [Clostridium sp.]|nr:hypothetical protein [Clostridium sp.]